jgi:sugar phosphate isomerase/epimerase
LAKQTKGFADNMPSPSLSPSRCSRRRFLTETASAFTGALLLPALARSGGSPVRSAEAGPHIAFPSDPRERIAIASYPFRDYLTPVDSGTTPGTAPHTRMELKDFAAQVVAKFNIHKIEPWSPHFISQEPAYLAGLQTAFQNAQVSVVNIAVDGQHSIFAIDAAERAAAIAESKSWIDVAVAVGSPSVRTHVAAAKDSGPDLTRAAESLRHVAEYAATKNVVVNLENDDPVTEDAFFIGKLVATVKSPWLHALPDFANSLVVLPERQAYDALDGMFSQAYNICHVKGLEVNAVGEKFRVNFARAFAILKHFNYRGFCSMEFDSPGDPYAATADLIKQTLKYLG